MLLGTHEVALLNAQHPSEIIDLDALLLGRMAYEKPEVSLAPITCLVNAAPAATCYKPTAQQEIETTVAALEGLSVSRQTETRSVPGGGIQIFRTSLLSTGVDNEHITLNLLWFPDVDADTKLQVSHETANGKAAWQYTGPWVIGELARLLLR